jgi:hypothetical protein
MTNEGEHDTPGFQNHQTTELAIKKLARLRHHPAEKVLLLHTVVYIIQK